MKPRMHTLRQCRLGAKRRHFRQLGRWNFRRRKRIAGNRPFHRKALRGAPVELGDSKAGYFSIMFRMNFQDGGSAVIRFPKPGGQRSWRKGLQWGCSDTIYPGPHFHPSAPNPNIDIGKLEMLHGQFADILLQLNKISLPQTGPLEKVDHLTYGMTCWPLSIHMDELVRWPSTIKSADRTRRCSQCGRALLLMLFSGRSLIVASLGLVRCQRMIGKRGLGCLVKRRECRTCCAKETGRHGEEGPGVGVWWVWVFFMGCSNKTILIYSRGSTSLIMAIISW